MRLSRKDIFFILLNLFLSIIIFLFLFLLVENNYISLFEVKYSNDSINNILERSNYSSELILHLADDDYINNEKTFFNLSALETIYIHESNESESLSENNADAINYLSYKENIAIAESGYIVYTNSYSKSAAYNSLPLGSYVGILKCAKVGLSVNLYFTYEQSYCDAYNSACVLPASSGGSLFGDSFGSIVADHNNQSFSVLTSMSVGDLLYVDAVYGEYVYRVSSIQTGYASSDGYYLYTSSGQNVTLGCLDGSIPGMVLYTCYYPSSGTTRLFIFCELVSGTMLV